jgi:hypothetical protein
MRLKLYIWPVKRISGIFLISIYMFSFAEFHNLVKLPVLFEHFREHRQHDAAISFWSFIQIHYFDPLIIDADYQKDRQLPFRDTDCCVLGSTSICEFAPVIMDIDPPAEQPREYYHFNEVHPPQFTPFDIFQPPRPLV